ncbi:MAG: hypothetical protein LBO04_08555 [Spirochaetaceae bacterium]|jgi:hypothetical protein|nr:hypothetical protein [Spirochaetaceae bacterium]
MDETSKFQDRAEIVVSKKDIIACPGAALRQKDAGFPCEVLAAVAYAEAAARVSGKIKGETA